MYTLYSQAHTCSMATHTILNLLNQPVEVIKKDTVEKFSEINPLNAVPVLKVGDTYLREGAAIILYLLNKHDNTLLATDGTERPRDIENILFAGTTLTGTVKNFPLPNDATMPLGADNLQLVEIDLTLLKRN